MNKILVINAGSSSLKFSLIEMPEEKEIAHGLIGRIGLELSEWKLVKDNVTKKGEIKIVNHSEAFDFMLTILKSNKVINNTREINGFGHRILHGGEKYKNSVVITDKVLNDIKDLTPLGPLHHPGEIAGIEAAQEVFKGVPNVAVFDTAFHQTIDENKYIYPVPYEWYQNYGVRKYGFHGTSHKYITETMQNILNKEDINIISCHIGSGASITAIKNSKSFDTTMGLTPLDGLMMCTRSGSVDPSILDYVSKQTGKSLATLTDELNKGSGFLGICGFSDWRDVEENMRKKDKLAILAIELITESAARYIWNYYRELDGKVDAIVFTAGIGENASLYRELVVNKLKLLGIQLDQQKNNETAAFKEIKQGIISTNDSNIPVYVIPTNEEIEIARDTYNLTKPKTLTKVK